jgi:hypothetical protein
MIMINVMKIFRNVSVQKLNEFAGQTPRGIRMIVRICRTSNHLYVGSLKMNFFGLRSTNIKIKARIMEILVIFNGIRKTNFS